ncbi:MAG: PD-(D/E)XK nuclease family protein [Vicinamibacterales bacterium]
MADLALSNSELELAQRCWRKWYFAAYRNLVLRDEGVAGPRAIGSRIHRALAGYYERQLDPVQLIRLEVESDAEAFPEQAEDVLKDGDLCLAMIEGYLEWLEETGADADLRLISTEREVRQPFGVIDDVNVEVVGTLDQRVQKISDGSRAFIDHKTVANFADTLKIARIAQQFLHYDLLEYLEFIREQRPPEERTDGGIYNMLRKVKRTPRATPPFYMRHEVRHNMDELRSYWLRVAAVAAEIIARRRRLDAGQDMRSVAYPTPNRDCSWSCDFFPICPLVDDGSDIESVIESFYEVREPRYKAGEGT